MEGGKEYLSSWITPLEEMEGIPEQMKASQLKRAGRSNARLETEMEMGRKTKRNDRKRREELRLPGREKLKGLPDDDKCLNEDISGFLGAIIGILPTLP